MLKRGESIPVQQHEAVGDGTFARRSVPTRARSLQHATVPKKAHGRSYDRTFDSVKDFSLRTLRPECIRLRPQPVLAQSPPSGHLISTPTFLAPPPSALPGLSNRPGRPMAPLDDVSNHKHQPKDYLTTLPPEILAAILQELPCLSLLKVRLAHPRLTACVAARPDYRKYQEVYRRMQQQLRRDRPRLAQAPKEGWPLRRAAELYHFVRMGYTTLDWRTFVFLERAMAVDRAARRPDRLSGCFAGRGGGSGGVGGDGKSESRSAFLERTLEAEMVARRLALPSGYILGRGGGSGGVGGDGKVKVSEPGRKGSVKTDETKPRGVKGRS